MKSKAFGAFIAKEFRHILRDTRTSLILLLMPVVLIFLLGFALSTDIRNINVAYISDTDNPIVQNVVRRIDCSDYFTVVGRLYSLDDVDAKMKSDDVDAAVRFSTENGLQIIVDASNPNMGASASMYLQNIIASQIREEMGTSGSVLTSAGAVTPIVRMLYNPRMQSSYNFIPGILGLILILICAMMTSVSIVREKESGTMEVLLTSPIRAVNIVFAKMVPYFVVASIDVTVILLIARFVLGVPLSGSLLLIILVCIIYIVLSLALGLLVSTLTDNQTTALIISAIVLMIPVMMLSGMMFPIESMPKFFQVFSNIVPARWFIDAMRKLMIQGLGFAYVAKDLIILSSIAIFLTCVSLANFKSRL